MTISEVKSMNRELFEDWLRDRLSDLPPEELERICAFYLDAIADRMEDGMTEEQAIHELGEPEGLLQSIRESLPEYAAYRPVRRSVQRRTGRGKWLLIAFGAALLVACILTPVLFLTRSVVRSHVDSVAEPVESVPRVDSTTQELVIPSDESDEYDEVGCTISGIGQLTVSVQYGTLQVEPSPDDDLHIFGPRNYGLWTTDDGLLLGEVQTDLRLQVPESLALVIKSELGDVTLSHVRPRSLQVSCDIGDITLDGVSACDRITLESQLGSISGSLSGRQSEYTIRSSVSLGGNSLPGSQNVGEIVLTATADNGSVELRFEEG